MFLCALTAVSFGASRPALLGELGHPLVVGLVLLAALKMRLVALHFMELGGAPLALRGALDAWVVGVAGLFIVLL